MTLHQQYLSTLEYLYQRLPMFQRIGPAAFKKNLGNISALMETLDNPHLKFKSIHIAGTNGKGSVAHMLSAVLQAQGYKTGLYTSPHYRDFRERIKVNGKYIGKKHVVRFVSEHQELIETLRPSFFEITVALAFTHFHQEKVDVAVVEVGLGGRLDSTNILSPLLSIITNISLDHQQFLGNTLPAIAGEKAGIIKQEIPVVIGETHPETKPVFLEKAKKMRAPITFADQTWKVREVTSDLVGTAYQFFHRDHLIYPNIMVNLHGPYQQKNLACLLESIEVINQGKELQIFPEAIIFGLAHLKELTRFMGRWQLLGEQPTILADSAHNQAGLQIVLEQLRSLSFQKLHIVMGTVNDKTVEDILGLFPSDAQYYFAKANIPRGLEAKKLQQKAAAFGLKGRTYSSVRNALRAAKRNARPEDLIFIGGSIFVLAEVI